MSSLYDFQSARQLWREDHQRIDQDPEGDRLAAIAEDRFRRQTYCDEDPECTCRFTGDRADASGCDVHGERRSMLLDAGLTPAEMRAQDRTCGYNRGQMAFDFDRLPPAAAVRLVESVDDLMLDEGVA